MVSLSGLSGFLLGSRGMLAKSAVLVPMQDRVAGGAAQTKGEI